MRNNVNRNIASTRDSALKKMQVEIKAGLYHCLKNSNQERHKNCPINSWRKFKKGLPCPDKSHHLDSDFKETFEKIYDRLSEPALLIRCLPGYTQNANESVNALASNKCPSISGVEESKLLWLHPLHPLCTSVVVQQKF